MSTKVFVMDKHKHNSFEIHKFKYPQKYNFMVNDKI